MYLHQDKMFAIGFIEGISILVSYYTTLYRPVIYLQKKVTLVGVGPPDTVSFPSL